MCVREGGREERKKESERCRVWGGKESRRNLKNKLLNRGRGIRDTFSWMGTDRHMEGKKKEVWKRRRIVQEARNGGGRVRMEGEKEERAWQMDVAALHHRRGRRAPAKLAMTAQAGLHPDGNTPSDTSHMPADSKRSTAMERCS